jgi:hypothetical protein
LGLAKKKGHFWGVFLKKEKSKKKKKKKEE